MGVDLLATLAVDRERGERPRVLLNAARPGPESGGDQARIDAAIAAVNRLTAKKIDTLLDRLQLTGSPYQDEFNLPIGHHALAEWLFDRPVDSAPSAENEPSPPHAAVIGSWPASGNDHHPPCYYLAAWLHPSYSAPVTPNQAAELVHEVMLSFRPPDPERAGAGDIMPSYDHGTHDELVSGKTRIPLRGNREWIFDSREERFYLSGLEPLVYAGHGSDKESARADLIARVQRDFQVLYGSRPPDRNYHYEQRWRMLARVIDLDKIHATEKLRMTRIGHVQQQLPDAVEVRWEDDEIERIARGPAPDEFLELPVGQRFETTAVYAFGSEQVEALEDFRPIEEEQIDPAKIAAFEEFLWSKA